MTTLCKRIIESADKYNVVLNTNNHTTTTTDHHNDMLQDVNFCRLLGCINQLKLLSLSIVETFDNLTCLVVDINDRALAANRRIESIASTLTDVDYKVKTTSIYNNANQVAKDTYNKTSRNPYNISLLIRNTNSPPKLWLLDNIIGENSDCVSSYSDINFFFSSWFESELKQQDDNKEKKRQEKKKARLLLTHQRGDDDDIENDEIEYWGEHDDIDESIASSVNDDDDNNDDRISTKSSDKNKTKFLKGATKVLKIFKRNSTSGGVKEEKDKGDENIDENATMVSKDSPNEKPSSQRKNSYLNAYDNITSSNIRDSITSKKLDSKEEEEIKEKIRDIKKYVDLDPQELPTFNVPNTKPNKKKTKKSIKKSKDKLNGKVAKMTIAETPAQRKGSIKIEDLVRRQSGRLTSLLSSDSPPFSPPFSPPSFISDGSPPSPIVPLRSLVSPIKGPPERAPSIAESVARQSIHKIFAASPPPPPPPPPPSGPSKLAISSLLSDIKKNQNLRRVSIKEKVDSRSVLLNSIRQRSKDVQERNVDSNKFDNLKSQTSNTKPTQNEAISAILANRKLIAGSESESDSDSDFSDD